MKKKSSGSTAMQRLRRRIMRAVAYCWTGVWREQRNTPGIRVLKTLNLSVRSFLDRNLQLRAMSLTYSTVLAIVPALALLVAIGTGFGLQNLLRDELISLFPAQRQAMDTAFSFVESYLKQASQGVFIGVGLIVLLWTVISLLANIEEAFNIIWDVKQERTLLQKVTDYIAICLLVPVLLICSAGVSMFMSTAIEEHIHLKFLTPIISTLLSLSPILLSWLAFTFSFKLIPMARVRLKYAAVAGLVCAVAFAVLQALFMGGQIFVSKYNAIYGSFAFLPLMLVWVQLSWLLVLFGCVLCYAMQNVFAFNYQGDPERVAPIYMRKLTVVVMTIVLHRFESGGRPLSLNDIAVNYCLPLRLVSRVAATLESARLVYVVDDGSSDRGLTPAVDPGTFTLAMLMRALDTNGPANFIPHFSVLYAPLLGILAKDTDLMYDALPATLVKDLPLPSTVEVARMLRRMSAPPAKA